MKLDRRRERLRKEEEKKAQEGEIVESYIANIKMEKIKTRIKELDKLINQPHKH